MLGHVVKESNAIKVLFQHMGIAMVLKLLKSPATVDCLYRAAEMQFDYLDYNDTCQIARKCIKALEEIEDDNTIDKLRSLANSKTKEIAEYAKKELHYKELL